MDEALFDKYLRDQTKQRLQGQNYSNYPVASISTRQNLFNMQIMKSDYNELRFMSRKPFNINQTKRDAQNKHFIKRKPDSDEEDEEIVGYGKGEKQGGIRRDKPLRGYLDEKDYELL